MRDIRDVPPLFDEIDAVFGVRGKPILFAWGDKIFNPAGVTIPQELIAHEAVHGKRQGDVVGWWRRYLVDPEFRLAEELPAHVAEFKSICAQHSSRWVSQANMRRLCDPRRTQARIAALWPADRFREARKLIKARPNQFAHAPDNRISGPVPTRLHPPTH
jgi:hypothetical protein